MIDFKDKDELPINIVICASFVISLVAIGCMFLLPKPVVPTREEEKRQEAKIKITTEDIDKQITLAKARLASQTWPGTPEEIFPIALRQVNEALQSRKLKLSGFHTQKTIEESNILLVPFIVSVEGAFPEVMSFTRDLERSGSKFVINIFQVSNADQSSDKVAASIGITAYQLPPAPVVTPTPANPVPQVVPVKPPVAPKRAKGMKKNA